MNHDETQHTERLSRARTALEGLSVGDAIGGLYEFSRYEDMVQRVAERRLPDIEWHYTDDTNMALSIYAVLRVHRTIDQDALAQSFAQRYDPGRGYGRGASQILQEMRNGAPWRETAQAVFGGHGSYGNGSAMRIAPIGGYFADDLDAVAEQAARSAVVTHAQPEAVAGAVAVAVATGLAWQLRGAPPPVRADFIDRVLPYIPESAVRAGALRARDLPAGTPLKKAVDVLGNGSRVSCMDTVPFVLWCAGGGLGSYEEAMWQTVGGGGDTDTTCAMVGGIVVMYTGVSGIPAAWLRHREPLPGWALGI